MFAFFIFFELTSLKMNYYEYILNNYDALFPNRGQKSSEFIFFINYLTNKKS